MIEPLADGIAFRIDSEGSATAFDWQETPAPREAAVFDWIHLNLRSEAAAEWLQHRSGLDTIVVDALMEYETRPRSSLMAGGILVVLRGVNLNPGSDPEDMISVRMWVEEGLVITAQRRPSLAMREMTAAATGGRGPRSAGSFLVEVAERLVENMANFLTELDAQVDQIEEDLLESPGYDQRSGLITVRRQAIALRRYLAPQRDALSRLLTERVDWLSDIHRLQLREITDTTIRYVEDLEAARERTAITQEELNNRLAEQLNQRMYLLSIITAIFLPLSFLTGLLGINVGGIPGAEDSTAFAVVCAGLVVLVVGQLFWLRHLRWF